MSENRESWYVLTDDWNGIEEIAIYGFGRVAQRNIRKLSFDFRINIIIDSSESVRKEALKNGIEVLTLQEANPFLNNKKIVVTTSSYAYDSIKNDLQKRGLQEYKDFCRLEVFMLEWYWKNRKEVCLSQVLSSITTRCTFNCRFCSNLMPYFKQQYEYTEDDIYEDLLFLFKRVDYLASYYIIGGEPLLNRNLPDILTKVSENFTNQIGYIQVITNGSIVPDNRLIEVLKRYDIKLRISDYTKMIPYKKKFEEVIKVCQKNDIEYSISDYQVWMSLGFPVEDVSIKGSYKMHMLNCSQGCHSVNDKKFYFCSTLWDAEKTGLYTLKERDCLDLKQTSKDSVLDKLDFLKYCLGDSEGHIGLCEKCRGFGKDNDCLVNVAEQMSKLGGTSIGY